MGNKKRIITLCLLAVGVVFGIMFTNSCQHQAYVLPENLRTGDPTICFERDILPIFQSNCAKSGCHDAGHHAAGYTLDNYTNIMKKGIVPGNVAASKVWESVSMKIFGVEVMPQGAPALNATELDLLRRWISTGAIDSGACYTSNCDTTQFTYSGTIAPLMQIHCTGCHNSASASGGSLMDYASVKDAAVNGRLIGDIEHLSGYNAMPVGGAQLEDCQITQIKKWVAAGAQNN